MKYSETPCLGAPYPVPSYNGANCVSAFMYNTIKFRGTEGVQTRMTQVSNVSQLLWSSHLNLEDAYPSCWNSRPGLLYAPTLI